MTTDLKINNSDADGQFVREQLGKIWENDNNNVDTDLAIIERLARKDDYLQERQFILNSNLPFAEKEAKLKALEAEYEKRVKEAWIKLKAMREEKRKDEAKSNVMSIVTKVAPVLFLQKLAKRF